METNLEVRCGRAILGFCDNEDCTHNMGHEYDDKTCNPRFCKVQGIPTRCIEEAGFCQNRLSEKVSQKGD